MFVCFHDCDLAYGVGGVIFPHINPIMHLIAHVQQDARRSDGCARTAVGIIAYERAG